MSGIATISPGTAWFLNGIANLQQQEAQTERQVSSGYRIQDAADSPAQTPELVELGSQLAEVQAYQTNLGTVQTEANTADSALSSAITLIQNAETIAQQGANTTTSAATRQNLATQVASIQQQLVSIANTAVGDRYIFAGDNDQSAPYTYDASAPTGVDTAGAQVSTKTIVNPQGQAVYQSLTAQQIFAPVDASGNATGSNTFAALASLVTALNNNDQQGISDAIDSLQSSASFVSQQQAYYGAAEQRITTEQNTSANQVTQLQASIGTIRDTNVAEAATDLTAESTEQSAAVGAESELSQMKTLFDYLG